MKKILLSLSLLTLAGAGCVLFPAPSSPPGDEPVACTLDAKVCPDGSYVGRVSPRCEFAPCPPSPEPRSGSGPCSGPGDNGCAPGYACTQECGPPVVRDTDPEPGWSCYPAGKQRICPICLSEDVTIATPDGSVKITELERGMFVWSRNAEGQKIRAVVEETSRTVAPRDHRVVKLVLSDQREVIVSPGHPTADGRIVGELKAGDAFDGGVVATTELVEYEFPYTYDFLPDSESGGYWANDIFLGSTLFNR